MGSSYWGVLLACDSSSSFLKDKFKAASLNSISVGSTICRLSLSKSQLLGLSGVGGGTVKSIMGGAEVSAVFSNGYVTVILECLVTGTVTVGGP